MLIKAGIDIPGLEPLNIILTKELKAARYYIIELEEEE
jgi:hypothetical protein